MRRKMVFGVKLPILNIVDGELEEQTIKPGLGALSSWTEVTA